MLYGRSSIPLAPGSAAYSKRLFPDLGEFHPLNLHVQSVKLRMEEGKGEVKGRSGPTNGNDPMGMTLHRVIAIGSNA